MARPKKYTGDKPAVLVRAVKFPVLPNTEQEQLLRQISDNLMEIWNNALQERMTYFHEVLKPLFEARRSSGNTPELSESLKMAYAQAPVNVDSKNTARSQRTRLTTLRRERSTYARIPCAWQQETLVILEGAYDSFNALRKNGDVTAHPPRQKDAHGFCEIQGLLSWQLQTGKLDIAPQKKLDDVHQHAIASAEALSIVLSPGKSLWDGVELRFAAPEYQKLKLARAVKLNKFVLSRDQKGRYQMSIMYAIPAPDSIAHEPKDVAFVALGASHLSVVSKHGETVIDLWRPDKHWKPLIEEAKRRGVLSQLQSDDTLKRSLDGGFTTAETILRAKETASLVIETVVYGTLRVVRYSQVPYEDIPKDERKLFLRPKQKGSREYAELWVEIARMYEIMRAQQLQNQREVIAHKLRSHGQHFVLIDHSPIRGKKGALADAQKAERKGDLGLNWGVQNTGSLARLRQLLESKAEEWGGTVATLHLEKYPKGDARERKLMAARLAREQFLKTA